MNGAVVRLRIGVDVNALIRVLGVFSRFGREVRQMSLHPVSPASGLLVVSYTPARPGDEMLLRQLQRLEEVDDVAPGA